MKRYLLLLAAVAVAALAFPSIASAAKAHFIDNQPNAGDPTCVYDGGNDITCSFKIAGLGNVEEVTADVRVTRRCTTQSGSNDPPGQQRSQPQTLDVDNGQTTDDSATFVFRRLECPGNQTTNLGDEVDFFVDGRRIGSADLINLT
jgi:hypothetical protein